MLYGMGTVFVFLTILVFATGLMSALVARFAEPDAASTEDSLINDAPQAQPSQQIIAAIKAAIVEHRNR